MLAGKGVLIGRDLCNRWNLSHRLMKFTWLVFSTFISYSGSAIENKKQLLFGVYNLKFDECLQGGISESLLSNKAWFKSDSHRTPTIL